MAWEGARAIAHPADSLGRNSPKRTRVEHAQPCRPARQPAAPRRTPGGPSARGALAVPLRSQSRVGEGGGRAEPARTLQTHLGCQQRRYCLTTPESPTRVEQTKLSGPPWTWGQAVVHLTVGGTCSRVTHKAVTLRWAHVPCRRPATAGGSSRAQLAVTGRDSARSLWPSPGSSITTPGEHHAFSANPAPRPRRGQNSWAQDPSGMRLRTGHTVGLGEAQVGPVSTWPGPTRCPSPHLWPPVDEATGQRRPGSLASL